LKILNKEIGFGKTILHLDIAKLHTGTPLDLPVIIYRAKKAGPTVLLSAGIHGNEVNGVEIVRQIIRKKYNVPAIGTIICIPVVNVFGFINQTRAFPDGRDLNRMFPGSKQGSLAGRFAYNIMQEIVPHVDYIIDFHTGGGERFNYSQIRVAAEDAESLELAKVFGTKFILNSENRSKSFRKSATDLGKKVLLFEGGKSLDLDRIVTQKAIQGTLRVLKHLHMATVEMEGAIESNENADQLLLQQTTWVRSPLSGMYRSFVKLGEFVKKGDVLGSLSDPYGSPEKRVKAPNDGYIICSNHAPIVNQGDALMNLSVIVEKL
jgi:predicted deacylase